MEFSNVETFEIKTDIARFGAVVRAICPEFTLTGNVIVDVLNFENKRIFKWGQPYYKSEINLKGLANSGSKALYLQWKYTTTSGTIVEVECGDPRSGSDSMGSLLVRTRKYGKSHKALALALGLWTDADERQRTAKEQEHIEYSDEIDYQKGIDLAP
jgi:hypothetical protein